MAYFDFNKQEDPFSLNLSVPRMDTDFLNVKPTSGIDADVPTRSETPVTNQAVAKQVPNDQNSVVGRTPNAETAQKDYEEAQRDPNITPSAYAEQHDNVYKGPVSGVYYARPDDSDWNDTAMAVMGAMRGYLRTGGSPTGVMDGAFNSYMDHRDRVHRFNQIDYLEQRGYNPIGIQGYLQDGDLTKLTKDKKEEVSGLKQVSSIDQGNNIHVVYQGPNGIVEKDYPKNLTPEQQQQKATSGKEIARSVDLGNRVMIIYKDGTSEYQMKGVNPGTQDNHGVAPGGTSVTVNSGQGFSFNKDMGTYGYTTQLPDGRNAFVHTSSKGTETKSGKNFIYTVINQDGSKGVTETGQIQGTGQDARLSVIPKTVSDALDTGVDIGKANYETASNDVGRQWNEFSGGITGHLKDEHDRFDLRNNQIASLMADRAVSSSNNAILQGDMEKQIGAGGQLDVNKSPDVNQHILWQQNKVLLGSRIDAMYRNASGGKAMPIDQYNAQLRQELTQYYKDHPEQLNSFGNKDNTIEKALEASGLSNQAGGAGTSLGPASAPEGYTHTNKQGITAKVINGQWIQQ